MVKQRIITAVIGALVLLLILVWGYEPWSVAVWLGSLVGVSEFTSMHGTRLRSILTAWGCIVVTGIHWWTGWHSEIGIIVLITVTLMIPVFSANRITLSHSALTLIGSLYIGYGTTSLVVLRDPRLGASFYWLMTVLLTIWATDTAAYIFGSWLKGPKLLPAISPGKTVSGALGGLLGAMGGAVLVGFVIFPHPLFAHFAIFGLLISILGQLGDLAESAYKRSAGVKDSGKILPGHGGVLDRVDSLLVAAPFAVYFITTVGGTWFFR